MSATSTISSFPSPNFHEICEEASFVFESRSAADFVAGGEQFFDDVGADVAGGACYEHSVAFLDGRHVGGMTQWVADIVAGEQYLDVFI
jgi:hypothetical protein